VSHTLLYGHAHFVLALVQGLPQVLIRPPPHRAFCCNAILTYKLRGCCFLSRVSLIQNLPCSRLGLCFDCESLVDKKRRSSGPLSDGSTVLSGTCHSSTPAREPREPGQIRWMTTNLLPLIACRGHSACLIVARCSPRYLAGSSTPRASLPLHQERVPDIASPELAKLEGKLPRCNLARQTQGP
jgi:hypothetical protein